jgi:hypothetical protein
VQPGDQASFYNHTSLVGSDELYGLYVAAVGRVWTTQHSINTHVSHGLLEADLVRPSVVAPFAPTNGGEGEGEGEGERPGFGCHRGMPASPQSVLLLIVLLIPALLLLRPRRKELR